MVENENGVNFINFDDAVWALRARVARWLHYHSDRFVEFERPDVDKQDKPLFSQAESFRRRLLKIATSAEYADNQEILALVHLFQCKAVVFTCSSARTNINIDLDPDLVVSLGPDFPDLPPLQHFALAFRVSEMGEIGNHYDPLIKKTNQSRGIVGSKSSARLKTLQQTQQAEKLQQKFSCNPETWLNRLVGGHGGGGLETGEALHGGPAAGVLGGEREQSDEAEMP
eukprot:3309646-Rhodomonas_salina.1